MQKLLSKKLPFSDLGILGIGFLLTIWLLFGFIFLNLVWQDNDGNVFLNQNNSWADWALHFTQGSAMANRSLLLNTSPILVGAPFTYPFVVNLISAVLVRVGVPFFMAFTVPSWIMVSGGINLLFLFYKLILKSELKSILATLLFLLNGGTGIFWVLKNPQKWSESTHIEELGIEWISVINSTLIPQRAFALGFLIGILALILIFHSLQKSLKTGKISNKTILISGFLLGILPIIHAHTFVALAIYFGSLVLANLYFSKPKSVTKTLMPYLKIGFVTCMISIIVFACFYQGLPGGQRIWFKPGWMAGEYQINWLIFWWRNWVTVPILATIGFGLVAKLKPKLAPWFVGFFAIFIFGNLFALQAYLWDNTKFFAWVSVGFSALAIIALAKIWERHRFGKILAIILFCFSIVSGTHDLIYTLNFKSHQYKMYSAEEMELVEWVKDNTDKNSIWLTSDKHNHWLYNLTGRQPVMGYQGWLWSHGYDYKEIANDVAKMYQNPEENLMLFEKYQINFVVVGPSEKTLFQANTNKFHEHFAVIKKSENYEIFAIDSQL